ncbi:MAG TPA: hypothetical protein DCS07_01570 [Bdellovibrionales bacterium]|nr:MAG: hypothetical protein A2Z97_05590 [Bdellovibrionales bacterium GWB1_52_6]OFZ04349.1 MAG: hypothetical protein A2X97_06805 [Bdellovibrionales bacterium GWA1_52_35]OFZ40359.1 MAG: hypothetical protein A2070_15160 [Bdellovibrionales bacterium GWC1_52_8]HAR41313.1 hypothetical protein [Bdellovibrionales bacterium]HCM40798.1 hypothetical protein [Bdellovibrionales bacterium]
MKIRRLIAVAVLVLFLSSPPTPSGADQAEAYINLSGNVPAFFEIWVRGVPGDLDLGPRIIVNDRLLGIMHLKYNLNLQSLTFKSDTLDGKLHNGASVWGGTMTFKVGGGATCMTVGGAAGGVASQLIPSGPAVGQLGGGADVHHPDVQDLATNFGYGLEEDCPVMASWSGVNQDLPLAGVFMMKITITMVSL